MHIAKQRSFWELIGLIFRRSHGIDKRILESDGINRGEVVPFYLVHESTAHMN